jgi:hypothetical protein
MKIVDFEAASRGMDEKRTAVAAFSVRRKATEP